MLPVYAMLLHGVAEYGMKRAANRKERWNKPLII